MKLLLIFFKKDFPAFLRFGLILLPLSFSSVINSQANPEAPQARIEFNEPPWYQGSGNNCNPNTENCYFPDLSLANENYRITFTEGFAPFPVFFDGWNSSPRESLKEWEWDFGTGTESDEGGRYAEGFNAAHVYETPGVYTTRLRVKDANNAWSPYVSVTINVKARNGNVFYVDSEIGDDSYDGKCMTPNGSGCGPWRTADHAFGLMIRPSQWAPLNEWHYKPGDQILFKRGQKFFFSNALNLGIPTQGYIFGAFGDPQLAKPLLQWAGADLPDLPLFYTGPGLGHIGFIDLSFRFLSPVGNRLLGLFFGPDGIKDILLLRCDFDEPWNGVFLFHGDHPENKPTHIFMVGCSVNQDETYVDSFTQMYGGPSHLALLNNTLDNPGNHIAYLTKVDKAVIKGNEFSRPAFGRAALRISGGPSDNSANNILIQDNKFLGWVDPVSLCREACPHNGGGTRYNFTLINISPGGNIGERLISDVTFEKNIITNYELGMEIVNVENMKIQNNLFVTPDPTHATAIQLSNDRLHPTGWMGLTRPLKNVSIENNTFLVNGPRSTVERYHIVRIYPWTGPFYPNWNIHTNISIKNNIFRVLDGRENQAVRIVGEMSPEEFAQFNFDYNDYYIPGASDYFQIGEAFHDFSWWQAQSKDLQGFIANPAFTSLVLPRFHLPGFPHSFLNNSSEASAYKNTLGLLGSSPAIDKGENIDTLKDDIFGTQRPQDGHQNGAFIFDLGAIEFSPTTEPNSPPIVNAGPNKTITLPTNSISLNATISDDGFPNPPGNLLIQWSKMSGPGTVTFSNAQDALTDVEFSAGGIYILGVNVNDGQLSKHDEVQITVLSPSGLLNLAPIVDAGGDQIVAAAFPTTNFNLNAVVSDDGLPTVPGSVSLSWTTVSKPSNASVSFSNVNDLQTAVTVSMAGYYIFRMTAGDGELLGNDEVLVTVTNNGIPSNMPPYVEAGSDQTISWPHSNISLTAAISDDGLPASVLNIRWYKVDGPGNVTFSQPANTATSAVFSSPGVYTIGITADDTGRATFDSVRVVLQESGSSGGGGPTNQAPIVNAGANQVITLPTVNITLNGTVTDDGRPYPPGITTYQWGQVSGPAVVSFSDQNSLTSLATFPQAGNYVLRLTASDSQLTTYDEMMVSVLSGGGPSNNPPLVNAGADQTISLPINSVTLNGSVIDDGLPVPPTITSTWRKISGPGIVTFSNVASPLTSAVFSANGVYVLRLTASDGQLSSFDQVIVNVLQPSGGSNSAPVVEVGGNLTVSFPINSVFLSAFVSDDGLPFPPGAVSVQWTKVSGPGDISFSQPTNPATIAAFSASGVYTIRLTAYDGQLTTTDELRVTVLGGNNTGGTQTTSEGSFFFACGNPRDASYQHSPPVCFDLKENSDITVSIYTKDGLLVKELARSNYSSGQHTLYWDRTDRSGQIVGSGVYNVVLTTTQGKIKTKIVVIK